MAEAAEPDYSQLDPNLIDPATGKPRPHVIHPPLTTLDELRDAHKKAKAEYDTFEWAKMVREFMKQREWNLDKTVAFGTDSFCRNRNAMYQLVMWQDIVAQLPNSKDVEFYAEEISYKELHNKFLTELEVIPIRAVQRDIIYGGPGVWKIDHQTFVMMFRCVPHRRVLLRHDVELYFGDPIWDDEIEYRWRDPEEEERKRDLLKDPEATKVQRIIFMNEDAVAMDKFKKERIETDLTQKDTFKFGPFPSAFGGGNPLFAYHKAKPS
ncbi:hypothetical protein EJ08DRAFT_664507 [Tothia fuscella]|uniref:Uncharacterized protein n=1 Tax=Tothia fuscella TaxID=1048955 RepID=A0A9P4NIQ5_9PEZI|nr:hypothetical protein EJ08DRAFT_664507 [Tothia fuscella]